MKATGAAAKALLDRPPERVRAVLLFGPDEGLVRERAAALVARVAGDPRDPFRVSELSGATLRDDPARLADEAAAIAMTGGRRAVRVREADDRLAAPLGDFLAAPMGDSLVVVEAGDLGPRSALRRLFEAAANAAAIGCYPDSAPELAALVVETLRAQGVSAEGEAVDYLVAHLGADRQVSRAELEKVVLYVGAGGRATLASVAACVGEASALSLADALSAAGLGDAARLERALDLALAAGASPVGILRQAANHLRRIQLAVARVRAGQRPDEAMARLRPPVFFKHRDEFARTLGRWSVEACARALDRLTEAEIACKTTGMPDEAVCRHALLTLAGEAARPRNP